MIVSASRRTDLPRWYGEWFENRLRAGYALARNPMNAAQVRKVSLCPRMWTVLCSGRKTRHFLPRLDLPRLARVLLLFSVHTDAVWAKAEPGMRDKREIARTLPSCPSGSGASGWCGAMTR